MVAVADQRAVDAVDDRCTPDAEFAALHAEFAFTVDAAASVANARLPHFWTRLLDGLQQPWARERVWCNPPYSQLLPWVEKATRERNPLTVMLLPANRTEQGWWQDMIEPYRDNGGELSTRFLRGRIKFIGRSVSADARCPSQNRPPFGNVLAIWRRP